jgi:hypothetical protein
MRSMLHVFPLLESRRNGLPSSIGLEGDPEHGFPANVLRKKPVG